MLKHEAAWLQRHLETVPVEELSPLLSIGSGTAVTRARQWWIDEHVFERLTARGVKVVHHEHHSGVGVDIAGDVTGTALWDRLHAVGARTVLCANVLEHVADPRFVADELTKLTPPRGHLLVTVPRRYPYHPDPIDTMYRPSLDELAGRFPGLDLVDGDEVECWSLSAYAAHVRGKRTMVMNGIRSVVSGRGGEGRANQTRPMKGRLRDLLPYVLGHTAVTCAVFQRPAV